ncbi:DUF2333 family protein [Martelella mediterranea]|uniref:DUF2333 family protein n=1 Tax=Martelella mediterranea TaxID=293089 RepID=A0A4R3NGS4_9HYPH|nr:hypothetical protein EDC90_10392 [Martelella mediterranea]
MLDSMKAFARRLWTLARRGLGYLWVAIAFPFRAGGGFVARRGWIVKGSVLAILVAVVLFYGLYVWRAEVWHNFNPDYVAGYQLNERSVPAGAPLPAGDGETAKVCEDSAIVEVLSGLVDMNVNQNDWLSSTLAYRLGFFGINWDHTLFLDNKASFQRGVHQAVRRSTVELVDSLGRVRGTSGVDENLQDARGNLQYDEYSWYFGLTPFGFKTPTPSFYRSAIRSLDRFNAELADCSAVFDARADNLSQFVDRVAADLGATSAILRERSENHNGGWFDPRADDRFWFAYGQLYGYYGILAAAEADFSQVIAQRDLTALWDETLVQFRSALDIQPLIISNGREDGWIMPSHLATIGFYILRARSNLVEVRSVLER